MQFDDENECRHHELMSTLSTNPNKDLMIYTQDENPINITKQDSNGRYDIYRDIEEAGYIDIKTSKGAAFMEVLADEYELPCEIGRWFWDTSENNWTNLNDLTQYLKGVKAVFDKDWGNELTFSFSDADK